MTPPRRPSPVENAQPLWGRPALRLDVVTKVGHQRWLVASELHLGLESQLARHGAFLRSRTLVLADALIADARTAQTRRLLLLGDVKHRYATTSRQETRDVPAFFQRIGDAFDEILITLGNHDTGLRDLLPRPAFPNVRFAPATGALLGEGKDRIGAFHGHAWPRPALLAAHTWLVGHTHAAAELVDEEGRLATEWAWFRGRVDGEKAKAHYKRDATPRLIVFPPYNPLCGGTPVNRDGLLGPIGKLADPKESSLWLLDGRRAPDPELTSLAARRRVRPEQD